MKPRSDRVLETIVSVALVLLTVAVYLPIGRHEFINYDDRVYVTENPNVLSGLAASSVGWAFTTGHSSNWHPVTWISHMLDRQLFGANPGAHHLVSLLLHVVNVVLLFLLLRRMTGASWPAAFVACLFAIHPQNVESVAWIAERKNVLSTLFWLLTIEAYVRYVARPSSWRFAAVLLAYGIGLMAKPMLVTLPCVLLLLDFWPLGRFGAAGSKRRALAPLLREKVPLFLMAAASSAVTYAVQRTMGSVTSFERLPLVSRLGNAVVSYATYALKAIWPSRLAVIYPYGEGPTGWEIALGALFVAGMTAMAMRAARRQPAVLVGWLWYLGTLVPVIGLVQVGRQARADRYAYVPLIGFFIVLAWGIPSLLTRVKAGKVAMSILAAAAIAGLTIVTSRQVGYWKDAPSLYDHTLEVTRNNAEVNNLYGAYLAMRGKPLDAVARYEEALRIRPDYGDAHYNLANALSRIGSSEEAVSHYLTAIRIKPDDADAHNNLAIALHRAGRLADAESHYEEALRLRPDYAQAHFNLAELLVQQGRIPEAISHYSEAVRIDPGYTKARERMERAAGKRPSL